jgi:hypothetical protein
MYVRPLLIGLLLAAAAAPATATAGTDDRNAAKACTSLQAALGSATFGRLYSSSGACVSAWTRTAHQARAAGESACQGKPSYASCVDAKTRTTLNAEVSLYRSAAQACASEEAALGVDVFAARYGTNAFGACVSARVSHKPLGPNQYDAKLQALNGSGVSGSVHIRLKGNELTVVGTLGGLESGQKHGVRIYGLASGSAACPMANADANHDGVVNYSEAIAWAGNPIFDVTPNVLIGMSGGVTFTGHYTVDPSKLGALETRAILVQGRSLGSNSSYDATVPVACGLITRSS